METWKEKGKEKEEEVKEKRGVSANGEGKLECRPFETKYNIGE